MAASTFRRGSTGLIFTPGGLRAASIGAQVYPFMASDIASMSTAHEGVPHGVAEGVGWKYNPSIAQGMQPNNSLISWWTGPTYAEWRAITAWFICYQEATGHTATNSAIEVSGVVLNVLRKTGVWEVLHSQRAPTWFGGYGEDAVSLGDPATWSAAGLDGGTEVQPGYLYQGGAQSIHGGSGRMQLWSTPEPDYDALHVVIRHRLVLRNRAGVDDRANARFIVQAGADYYPTLESTVLSHMTPPGYAPGVAVGRFMLVTPEWRYSTMTVRNPGIDLVATPPPALTF